VEQLQILDPVVDIAGIAVKPDQGRASFVVVRANR